MRYKLLFFFVATVFSAALFFVFLPSRTYAAPLSPPTLLAPSNGSTITDTTPFFDWTFVSGAVRYIIEVREGSRSGPIVIADFSSFSAYTPSSPLATGNTYWWRAAGCDNPFCSGALGWATPSTFFLSGGDTTPPNITTIRVHSDTSTPWESTSGNPDFGFSTNENATCRIGSSNVSYSSMVWTCSTTGGTTHTCQPPVTYTPGSHTLYTACRDSAGNENTPFSSPRTHQTDFTVLYPAPTLNSPANFATNQPTNVSLSWNTVSPTPPRYLWEVREGGSSGPVVRAGQTTSTSSGPMSPALNNGTTYFWRAGSCQNSFCSGTISWSSFRRFTTIGAAVCSGTISLDLNPNPAFAGQLVTPSASGFSGCSAETVFFRQGSCGGSTVSQCSGGSFCSGSPFSAPSSGTAYFACLDKNGDSSFAGAGEQDSELLQVTAGSGETNCTNGFDDDGDGLIDCSDTADCPCPGGTTCDRAINQCIVPPGAPTVVLKADDGSGPSDGPITVASGASVTLSWTTTNSPTSCNAGGPSWSGSKDVNGGSETVTVTSSGTWVLACTNSFGSGSDSVVVNLTGGGGPTEAGLCSNDVDDDVDGPKDCNDSDCFGDTFCTSGTGCIGGTPDGTCDVAGGETSANCSADCPVSGAGVTVTFKNPLGAATLTDLVNNIINFLFTIAVIVAPILLVIAGVMFMTAAGDASRVATARRMLLWTIVGFGVILISKGLVEVLKGILGLP